MEGQRGQEEGAEMEEPTRASKKPGINEVDSLQPEAPWTSMQQTESATQAGGVTRRAGTSLFRNERASGGGKLGFRKTEAATSSGPREKLGCW